MSLAHTPAYGIGTQLTPFGACPPARPHHILPPSPVTLRNRRGKIMRQRHLFVNRISPEFSDATSGKAQPQAGGRGTGQFFRPTTPLGKEETKKSAGNGGHRVYTRVVSKEMEILRMITVHVKRD